MTATKKTSTKNPAVRKMAVAPATSCLKTVTPAPSGGTAPPEHEMSGDELIIENFAAVSRLVETMGEALELLTQKVENMAYHIIATEEILAELVADNGINLPRVNTRIRQRISAGTDCCGDPSRAIDVAASIASPLPRR